MSLNEEKQARVVILIRIQLGRAGSRLRRLRPNQVSRLTTAAPPLQGLIQADTDPLARHSCTSHLMSHFGCLTERMGMGAEGGAAASVTP